MSQRQLQIKLSEKGANICKAISRQLLDLQQAMQHIYLNIYGKSLRREVDICNNRMDMFLRYKFECFAFITGLDSYFTLHTAMKQYPQYFSPTQFTEILASCRQFSIQTTNYIFSC
jgi:hypothetical protein